MLNSMAGREFEQALDRHIEWGLDTLDLKDQIYGKTIDSLTPEEAQQAAQAISARGLDVSTLSTGIFYGDIEHGEAAFLDQFNPALDRILKIGSTFRPRNVRLLSAQSSRRATFSNSSDYIQTHHPWVIPVYRRAIQRLHEAGFQVVIENEVRQTLFTHPKEILDFFEALDCAGQVGLTWDIGNLWEEGTFPSMSVYEQLKPLIRMIHLKGGKDVVQDGVKRRYASSLEHASWNVLELVKAAIRDGVSPVICLNPAHGTTSPDYDHSLENYHQDIAFLRRHVEDIA
jgi:sugar phosphate isomerase/epimerase